MELGAGAKPWTASTPWAGAPSIMPTGVCNGGMPSPCAGALPLGAAPAGKCSTSALTVAPGRACPAALGPWPAACPWDSQPRDGKIKRGKVLLAQDRKAQAARLIERGGIGRHDQQFAFARQIALRIAFDRGGIWRSAPQAVDRAWGERAGDPGQRHRRCVQRLRHIGGKAGYRLARGVGQRIERLVERALDACAHAGREALRQAGVTPAGPRRLPAAWRAGGG
jgi:hypothetical protein